jgi:hypothetical protein
VEFLLSDLEVCHLKLATLLLWSTLTGPRVPRETPFFVASGGRVRGGNGEISSPPGRSVRLDRSRKVYMSKLFISNRYEINVLHITLSGVLCFIN